MREWRGFDTETVMGRAILCTTDQDALAYPRSFAEIVEWLAAQGERFSAFNMDYDARAGFLMLPRPVLTKLHYNTRAIWRGYKLEYLPRKCLAVTTPEKKRIEVYDVRQFYGGSLASAARAVGMEKHELPKSWYWRMDWALEKWPETVIAYALEDADIARALMVKVETSLSNMGRPCKRPFSPAAVARAYFGERLKFDEPRWVQYLHKSAYRGGRIEVFQRGRTGAGVALDLNSAYPAALARALDPRKMTLAHTKTFREDAFYGSYRCEVTIPREGFRMLGPLAYTDEIEGVKTAVYPTGIFEVVLDRESYKLARDLGIGVKILDSWEYIVNESILLFPEIPALYERRKTEPELSLAIKLTLNGLYGILCQEIGVYVKAKRVTEETRELAGAFQHRISRLGNCTHFAVAAFVTGATRALVYRLASLRPSKLLYIATDGVGFQGESPIQPDEGKPLGGWSAETFEDSVIVGCGVYSLKKGGKWVDKMRGLRTTRPLIEMLDTPRRTWKTSVVNVDTLADHVRESGAELNVIRKIKRTFDVNFDVKRAWPEPVRSARFLLENRQTSETLEVV